MSIWINNENTSLYNCSFTEVIYVVSCPCPLLYVGKMIWQMERHILEHINDVTLIKERSVARHVWVKHGGNPEWRRFLGGSGFERRRRAKALLLWVTGMHSVLHSCEPLSVVSELKSWDMTTQPVQALERTWLYCPDPPRSLTSSWLNLSACCWETEPPAPSSFTAQSSSERWRGRPKRQSPLSAHLRLRTEWSAVFYFCFGGSRGRRIGPMLYTPGWVWCFFFFFNPELLF